MMKQKVLAYILRTKEGIDEILVFDHVAYPEVSPQVPAGSIDDGETPEDAVVREIFEESGLMLFPSQRLGEFEHFKEETNEQQLRHVFEFANIENSETIPEAWRHIVSSGEQDAGYEFSFYWMPISEAKEKLVADMGKYLK